jgi:hypothetical protein
MTPSLCHLKTTIIFNRSEDLMACLKIQHEESWILLASLTLQIRSGGGAQRDIDGSQVISWCKEPKEAKQQAGH